MRRNAALLVALALAGATAISTGAVPLTATDDVSDRIHLSPVSDHAYLDDEGELVIDASSANPKLTGDGVNPDALTYVDNIFRIHHDGDGTATVWFDVDADAITVQSRGRPVDSPANAVELGPGDAAPIGVVVDTTGDTSESDFESTVHVRVGDSDDGTPGDGPRGDTRSDSSGDPDTEPSVRVDRPTEERRSLSLRDAVAGRPPSVDLDRLTVDRAGDGVVTLDGLAVVGAGDIDLDVRVAEPGSTDPLPADARPLGAVRVDERMGTVDRATLRFGVDRAYLEATGLSADELRLFRYDEGDRSELDLSVVARGEDRVVVEAETPGFSTFVVAADTKPGPPDRQPTPAESTTGAAVPDDPGTGMDGDGRVGTPAATPADTPVAPDGDDETAAVDTGRPVAEPGGFRSGVVWVVGALALLALVAFVRRTRGEGNA